MSSTGTSTQDTIKHLRRPETIKERAKFLYERALAGGSQWWHIDPAQIEKAVNAVVDVTKKNYPTLEIPFHSRWRHFAVNNEDRIGPLVAAQSPDWERLPAMIELAIISVLLDAGAGDSWQYQDPRSGCTVTRSEGLAIASLNAYEQGRFSSQATPLRVDADRLLTLTKNDLIDIFQVTAENPLAGLDGRLELLRRLGENINTYPQFFPNPGRLGSFGFYLKNRAQGGKLAAPRVLEGVLAAFNDIWPKRHTLDGINLGDVWPHSALAEFAPGQGWMPFHKLSQWLTYSLLEPLMDDGIAIEDIDQLTGLAEYRNGGLFLDYGVISLRDPDLRLEKHLPGSELIVEWRALTIALIEVIAPLIRSELGRSDLELPLPAILQGGTWAAGRAIAQSLRKDSSPPLQIESDGTVF